MTVDVQLPLTLSEAVLVNGMRSCQNEIAATYGNDDIAWERIRPLAENVNWLLLGVSNADAAWALGAVLQTILRMALEVPLDAV